MEIELKVVTLIIYLLFFACVIAIALKRFRIPFTVVVLLGGLILGTTAKIYVEPMPHAPPAVMEEHGVEEGAERGEVEGGVFKRIVLDFLRYVRSLEFISPALIFFVFLPALVFESAYSLDPRELYKNILPVLTLAIPSLIISTLIVGGILSLTVAPAFGLTLKSALLFGALISATDPVAVVAIFRDLGAPKRLTTLVEGESLFNDATAIVLFTIILGIVVGGGSRPVSHELASGAIRFIKVFFGGVLVGGILAYLFLQLIGKVFNDELVEITLTTVMAYTAFIIAEHYLHFSGVMATLSAGVLTGSYGRTKISPAVVEFMHEFWKYLSFVANSLIFFLVGIIIPLKVPWEGAGAYVTPLLWTILAIYIARASGIFPIMPLLGRYVERINPKYQAIMYWGGLRGAIALALALTLATTPGIDEGLKNLILVLAAGVVLTTLLVNAITIRPLVMALGLDKYTPGEAFARNQSILSVQEEVLARIEEMREEKTLLPTVLDRLEDKYERRSHEVLAEVEKLKSDTEGFSQKVEEEMFTRQCLDVEKRAYMELFGEGSISEGTTKELQAGVDVLLDHIRAGDILLPQERRRRTSFSTVEENLVRAMERLPLVSGLAQRYMAVKLANLYDEVRGQYLAFQKVLEEISRGRRTGAVSMPVLDKLETAYTNWKFQALERMNVMAVQYQNYVEKIQSLITSRLCLNMEMDAYKHLYETGVIAEKIFEEMARSINAEMERSRAVPVRELRVEPMDLIRQIPYFQALPEKVLQTIAAQLNPRTYMENQLVFAEGDAGSSMYLIARGAVKVISKDRHGRELILDILGAGNFFGEMALLTSRPRTATVQAITPLNLLELRRNVLDEIIAMNREFKMVLETAFMERVMDTSLAKSEAFQHLSADDRKRLMKYLSPADFNEGEAILEAGEPMPFLFVRDGSLTLGALPIREGEFVGEETFIREMKAPARITAASRVNLYILGREKLESLRKEVPEILTKIEMALKG